MPKWSVDIKRDERLGTVEAPNAREAIKEAIKKFEIPPASQGRIAVTKLSKDKD